MTNEVKKARLIQSINETERDLIKAEKMYNDTLLCIKRDEEEGYRVTQTWLVYCNKDKKKVDCLKAHLEKLNKMLVKMRRLVFADRIYREKIKNS